jgi:hypothetical protein
MRVWREFPLSALMKIACEVDVARGELRAGQRIVPPCRVPDPDAFLPDHNRSQGEF